MRAAVTIWRCQRYPFTRAQLILLDAMSVMYLAPQLVLPTLMCAFFRRPEVRASFGDATCPKRAPLRPGYRL